MGSLDLPEPDLQLKAFIANLGITAIVVDADDKRAVQWRQLLSSLDVAPQEIGGVVLYRIAPYALKTYRATNAINLEQRADRARFDALISATDRYFASGGDSAKLNVPNLEAAGLERYVLSGIARPLVGPVRCSPVSVWSAFAVTQRIELRPCGRPPNSKPINQRGHGAGSDPGPRPSSSTHTRRRLMHEP